MERPGYMPRTAIAQELKERNAIVNKRREHEGTFRQLKIKTFVKASTLDHSEHEEEILARRRELE